MRVAAAQEGQERHGSRTAAIRSLGLARVRALSHATGALLEVESPAAIRHLMLDDPLERPVHRLLGGAAAAVGRGDLGRVGPPAQAAAGAADRADGGHHVGGRRRLAAEVGEFDRHRRRIEVVGDRRHLDGRHRDFGGDGHVGGGIGRVRHLLGRVLLLLELTELLLRLGRAGGDDRGLVDLRRLAATHQRHRQEQHDVDEQADGPGRRLAEEATRRRANIVLFLMVGIGLSGGRRRLRRGHGGLVGRFGGRLRRRNLGGRLRRHRWLRLGVGRPTRGLGRGIGFDLARHVVTPSSGMWRTGPRSTPVRTAKKSIANRLSPRWGDRARPMAGTLRPREVDGPLENRRPCGHPTPD